MVFFTCNNCGESLQKPKVDKHYQTTCRSAKNLTCVDCLKDFRGEEYASHIKCMTEVERYAAKGSLPNGVIKKGEVKQQSWTDMIKNIIEKETNLSVPLKNMLNIIASYTNVPRKKIKFMNFVSNSFGRSYNRQHIEEIWNLIEKHKEENFPKKENSKDLNKAEQTKRKNEEKLDNDSVDEIPKKKKKKDKALKESDNVNESESQETKNGDIKKKKNKANVEISEKKNGDLNCENANNHDDNLTSDITFSFEDKILEILNSKKQISITKLEKKVLNAYIKHRNLEAHSEKHVKKFNKRLKKLSQVEIKNGIVILL